MLTRRVTVGLGATTLTGGASGGYDNTRPGCPCRHPWGTRFSSLLRVPTSQVRALPKGLKPGSMLVTGD